jgi:hypothetical protein
MGGAFGLFMSSFEYAGPMMNEDLVKQTTKQQIKHVFKDMGTRAWSMAKNFGVVGMIYSGSECCIESVSRLVRKHYEFSNIAIKKSIEQRMICIIVLQQVLLQEDYLQQRLVHKPWH